MKRAGFTMIELIFVIVILGILAAVAIPKLAATRDDAKISAIIGNTRTALGDFKSFYTSQGYNNYMGTTKADIKAITDVPFTTGGCDIPSSGAIADGKSYDLCDGSSAADKACISVVINSPSADENNLTVIDNAQSTAVCQGVSGDPAIKALAAAAPGKEHKLGGVGVVR